LYEERDREKYLKKLMKLVNSLIKVQLVDGSTITGKLVGIDPDYLNLILEELSGEDANTSEYILIPGSSINYIRWIKSKKRESKNLEVTIIKLLEKEPNLTKEELAKILNTDVKSVEKVIKNLKKKGLINRPQNENK